MKRDEEKSRDELLEELGTLRRQVAQFSDEEALRDSETQFRTVVESLDEGLLITDLDDRVVYMNPRVTEMTGYTPEEMVGQLAYKLLLASDKWSSLQERNQERGQGISERYEMEMTRKDGSTFWSSNQAIPYRDPLGKVVGTLGVIVDITDRRQTEEELIRLERLWALGEMAQGVAHNFNNLMVGVLGYAQLIQVKAQDAQISEDVMGIIDSALQAKELVKRLTRSVEGDRGSTPTAVWVQEVVDEAIEATRPRWKDMSEAKGVAVDVVTDLQDVPPIWGTREGMYDILINLILNAVDAMPEGGTISISTASSRTRLVLRVQDTGVGMDEETRKRAFEPFFTRKTDVGSGLGLSAVHGTVTRWGGSVDVESTPGQGTTVRLHLPIWTGKTELKEAETSGRRSRGYRILVVDDDKRVCRVLYYMLSEYYQVETVLSSQAALERMERGRYQVALIDLGMPGMPGDRLVTELRQIDPFLATVLITGWELEPNDIRRQAFDLALQKPFHSLSDVQDVITQSIRLYESRMDERE